MIPEERDLLSEAERALRRRFTEAPPRKKRSFQSTATLSTQRNRLEQLVLPDEMRPSMPLTKDKFLVKEDPQLVLWEREMRKFLRNLSPEHGHRVSAVMVYEWATGLSIVELERELLAVEGGGGRAAWKSDLRRLNKLLRHYFGKPYMTWIAGRKVPKAYQVPQGYYITRHRPMTLVLYAEYCEGTLVA
jgi:hypothetical protein